MSIFFFLVHIISCTHAEKSINVLSYMFVSVLFHQAAIFSFVSH